MKKVLITGSSGLVGSACMDYFVARDWATLGIDADMRHEFFDTPSKDSEYYVDIRDYSGLLSLFERNKFDAIIHTAAQPSHDWSKDDPLTDFEVNAQGTLYLLELTRRHNPDAVFVHVSTDKVYGWGMRRAALEETGDLWFSDRPFDEATLIEPPLSPFGVSKLCADMYAQEYAAQGWVTTGIFRPGCITGQNHEGAEQHGFLAYLVKCIKEGKTYKIFGYDGKQVRDQIHARDLAGAFYHFINNPRSGEVYNIGGGYERALSPLSAGAIVAEKLGKPFKYEYVEEPRFGDRQWDVHDISKFREHYPDWDFEYSLDQLIDDVCS